MRSMKSKKRPVAMVSMPITAFFQKKQPRQEISNTIINDDHTNEHDPIVNSSDDEDVQPTTISVAATKKLKLRTPHDARSDLTSILMCRELGGMGGRTTQQQMPRRRHRQQLVRWALAHFQPLHLEFQLPSQWPQRAGVMLREGDTFFTTSVEFDAHGVLFVAGGSNGVLAVFDFDEFSHRMLNCTQRKRMILSAAERNTQENGVDMESSSLSTLPHEVLHPIHLIYTRQEIRRIRWNPLNQDEIACCFSNRNEIYLYNLQKFPTKPHRVLKGSSRPSSGYDDFVFVSLAFSNGTRHGQSHSFQSLKHQQRSSIIAADIDGTLRMWDLNIPSRPVWSVSSGSQPITALIVSSDNQYLVCGNESGMLMTFDIQNLIVPAFASKAVPPRKAAFHIIEAIKPYLSPDHAATLLLSTQSGGAGIISIRTSPFSATQVLCQLRNDWVVIVDFLDASVTKLHTVMKANHVSIIPNFQQLEHQLVPKMKASIPASVLSTRSGQDHVGLLPPTPVSMNSNRRSSSMHSHRCAGTFLFHDSILCTGVHDSTNLNVIDLHQLPRAPLPATEASTLLKNLIPTPPLRSVGSSSSNSTNRHEVRRVAIERLDRFRIPVGDVVTAVSAHPNQQLVVCGGEGMRLKVLAMAGELDGV